MRKRTIYIAYNYVSEVKHKIDELLEDYRIKVFLTEEDALHYCKENEGFYYREVDMWYNKFVDLQVKDLTIIHE